MPIYPNATSNRRPYYPKQQQTQTGQQPQQPSGHTTTETPETQQNASPPSGQSRPDTRPFMIQEKILDMMKYGKPAVANFPGRERVLADEIRRSMQTMLRLAIIVKKKYYKKTTLQELDVELEILQKLIQIAQDKSYYGQKFSPPLSAQKYKHWSGLLTEIGKMIGGYMKSFK